MRFLQFKKARAVSKFAATFVLMLCLTIFAPSNSLAQSGDSVAIIWKMTETEAENVAPALDYDGDVQPIEGEDVRGAPLVVLVGLAVLPSLVDNIITFYRDLTQGGVIIDATGEELEIVSDTSIPYGTILIRDDDGVEVQNFRSTPKPADLSDAIVQALKATAAK